MKRIYDFNKFILLESSQEGSHLFFNGNRLDFIENGVIKKSWKACSGRSYYQWYVKPDTWMRRYTIPHAEWSKSKQEGPIPPGKYELGKVEERDLNARWRNDENFVKLTMAKQAVKILPGTDIFINTDDFYQSTDPSRIAWGNFRFSLNPKKGTNTFGRGGFFLHGGSIPGSIGCVDLATDIRDFGKFYKEWLEKTGNKTIELVVDYKTFDKKVPIEVDSQPYKMKYNPLDDTKKAEDWYNETDQEIEDVLNANKIRLNFKELLKQRRQ
jgi:hypothetical protein